MQQNKLPTINFEKYINCVVGDLVTAGVNITAYQHFILKVCQSCINNPSVPFPTITSKFIYDNLTPIPENGDQNGQK